MLNTGNETQARALLRVPKKEEVWFASSAELWHQDRWQPGRFVVFRTKVGFYQAAASSPLLDLSFSDMDPKHEPTVRKVEDHPLSNEEVPCQLWMWASGHDSARGDDLDARGVVAVRKFPMDPKNPKRVARLVQFLWQLERDCLEPGYFARLWSCVDKNEAGNVVPRTDLRALTSCIMFKLSTVQLKAFDPGIVTFLDRFFRRNHTSDYADDERDIECDPSYTAGTNPIGSVLAGDTQEDVVFARFTVSFSTKDETPQAEAATAKLRCCAVHEHNAEVILTSKRLVIRQLRHQSAYQSDAFSLQSGGCDGNVLMIPMHSISVIYRDLVHDEVTHPVCGSTHPSKKTVSLLIICESVNKQRHYRIRAPKEVSEYYHLLVLDAWLDSLRAGVAAVAKRLGDALDTAVHRSASGSLAPKQQSPPREIPNSCSMLFDDKVFSHLPRSTKNAPPTDPLEYASIMPNPGADGTFDFQSIFEPERVEVSGSGPSETIEAKGKARPNEPIQEVPEGTLSAGTATSEGSNATATVDSKQQDDDARNGPGKEESNRRGGGGSAPKPRLSTSAGARPAPRADGALPKFVADASLSLLSMRRLLGHFQSTDSTVDGTVREDEFRKALGPLFRSSTLPSAFVQVFDRDRVGSIPFVQFLTGMTVLLQTHSPDRLTFLFLLFSDADGTVSAASFHELIKLLVHLGGVHPKFIEATVRNSSELADYLFSTMDNNRNGRITLLEFRHALQNKRVQTTFRRLRHQADYLGNKVHGPQDYNFIGFGDENWQLLLDLLDGIRASVRHSTPLERDLGLQHKGEESVKAPALPTAVASDGTGFGDASWTEETTAEVRGSFGATDGGGASAAGDVASPNILSPMAFESTSAAGRKPSERSHTPEPAHTAATATGLSATERPDHDLHFTPASDAAKKQPTRSSMNQHAASSQTRAALKPTTSFAVDENFAKKDPGKVFGEHSLLDRCRQTVRYYKVHGGCQGEGGEDTRFEYVCEGRGRSSQAFFDAERTIYEDHAPSVFCEIRALDNISMNGYLHSLGLNHLLMNVLTGSSTALKQWIVSGAEERLFLASFDDLFVVKSISTVEKETLTRILPAYYEHVKTNPDTLLTKYYSMATLHCNGKRISFVIMRSLLQPERPIRQVYDLKGVQQRTVPPADRHPGVALKDADLRRHLTLDFEWYESLRNQIRKDVGFLKRQGLSNYALVCGIDSAKDRNADGTVFDAAAALAKKAQFDVAGVLNVRDVAKRFCCCGTPKKKKRKNRRDFLGEFDDVRSPVVPTKVNSFKSARSSVRFDTSDGDYENNDDFESTITGASDDVNYANTVSKRQLIAHAVFSSLQGELNRKAGDPSYFYVPFKRSVFQQHFGGVPSSAGSEAFYFALTGYLTQHPVTDEATASKREVTPDAYAARFLSWVDKVIEGKGGTQFINVKDLPDDVTYDVFLDPKASAQLRMDVRKQQMYLLSRDQSTTYRLRKLDTYDLSDPDFSIEKPVDKDRLRVLCLRQGAKASAARVPRVTYESTRNVFFQSLRDREEFSSMCALIRLSSGGGGGGDGGGRLPPGECIARTLSWKRGLHDSDTAAAGDCQGLAAGLRTLPITIFAGTWNVGGKPPTGVDDLNGWLGFGRECDIVAVTAQECDYKPRKSFESCEEDWFYTVLVTLNEKIEYAADTFVMVDGLTMWQLRLVVFAKRKHMSRISDCSQCTEGTGIAHVGGNKGGVAIAMKFMETPIVFLGCHLAAHQGSIQRRHSDIDEIIAGISSSIGTWRLQVTAEFPHVFLMGDLNYRIDTREDSKMLLDEFKDPQAIRLNDRHEVLAAIQAKDYATLRRDDQLLKAMAGAYSNNKLLPHFVEAGPIVLGNGQALETPNFPPTFKVFSRFCKQARENNKLDLANDYQGFQYGGVVRVPSWCDRILRSAHFTHKVEQNVQTLSYDSCVTVVSSDHKPVYAVFKVHTRMQYIHDHINRNPARRMVIQLFHLSASNVMPADPNGLSDPYLLVYTTFAPRVKTPWVNNTLNPRWKEVLTILPAIGDAAFLQTEYLHFSVCDRDNVGSDDLLGQSVLSLDGLVAKDMKISSFQVPLYCEGRSEGKLQGSIMICEKTTEELKNVVSGPTSALLVS
ncbi:Type II inositol polyphosphate 5-phosphatase 15 [Diplonema papillatum]|nr:Type II inositol polyphosphate 5-phosphatase 15 [Diplonema papillatum]|eukprot:gene15250-23290_t